MLIGIDVGNTNITVGLFRDGNSGTDPDFSWRLNTVANATADEIAAPLISHLLFHGLDPAGIDSAVVSSVVPDLYYVLRRMLEETFQVQDPLFVDHTTDTGLTFDYPLPEEIGADRIVNAAAAYKLYGGPLIIIDFGTATTFCCVDADGAYLGGQILPGVGISLHALTSRAAKLSSVRIAKPERAIGKSTRQGMSAGIYYQTVGAIEKISSMLIREMGGSPRVLATGGVVNLFSDDLPVISLIDHDLTLKGLKIIHDRQQH